MLLISLFLHYIGYRNKWWITICLSSTTTENKELKFGLLLLLLLFLFLWKIKFIWQTLRNIINLDNKRKNCLKKKKIVSFLIFYVLFNHAFRNIAHNAMSSRNPYFTKLILSQFNWKFLLFVKIVVFCLQLLKVLNLKREKYFKNHNQ